MRPPTRHAGGLPDRLTRDRSSREEDGERGEVLSGNQQLTDVLEERIDALISRKHEMVKGLFGGDGDDSELSKLSAEELLSLIALDPSLAHIDEA